MTYNYTITSQRLESQRKYVLPLIDKKLKEMRDRPITLYINLVTVFSGSALGKSLTPESPQEAALLRDVVVKDLQEQGYTLRTNGTHVIELTVEK